MPIDTLKAAKRLQEEGTFSAEQAERIAEILSDMDVASATKEDLDALEERLARRIDDQESRVESRLDALQANLENYVTSRVGWAAGLLALYLTLLNYLLG